jgi:flagellar biosynthetic protein FlhB
MAEDQDDSSKTEEPSHKKLEEARKRGQLVSSREVNHFFIIVAFTFFVLSLGPHMAQGVVQLLEPFITQPDEMEMSAAGFSSIMRDVIIGTALLLAIPLLATFAAALAPSFIQNKWVIAVESIKPKFEKISPKAGLKRLLGMKAWVEFLKNLLKIAVIAAIAVSIALPHRHELESLPALGSTGMLAFAQAIAAKMLLAVCVLLFLLSIGDYLWQRHTFLKQMRMSRQEMKDEYKQQEGDPHIKQKLKQIRREKARQRMMANVPKADVIITNPTHYAVALQYDPSKMPAPKLIAKGADDVAGRIREMATKNKIPIVRNPPLARILYDTTDIDDEIPIEHYAAVAKVIGYVYKLKGKKPPQPAAKTGPIKIDMPTKKK